MFSSVYIIDLPSGRWTVLPPMTSPRHGLAAAAVGKTRLPQLMDGSGHTPRYCPWSLCRDRNLATWSALPALGVARHRMTVVPTVTTLLAVNGANRPTPTESVATVEALGFS